MEKNKSILIVVAVIFILFVVGSQVGLFSVVGGLCKAEIIEIEVPSSATSGEQFEINVLVKNIGDNNCQISSKIYDDDTGVEIGSGGANLNPGQTGWANRYHFNMLHKDWKLRFEVGHLELNTDGSCGDWSHCLYIDETQYKTITLSGSTCQDDCSSLNLECGDHIICGSTVHCGDCTESMGYNCIEGKCVPTSQTGFCGDGICQPGELFIIDSCPVDCLYGNGNGDDGNGDDGNGDDGNGDDGNEDTGDSILQNTINLFGYDIPIVFLIGAGVLLLLLISKKK